MSDQQPELPVDTSQRPASRFVVGIMIAVILALALAAVPASEAWRSAQNARCKERLRQIARALNEYHDRYSSFPPAYTVSLEGAKLQSWRALILPFLGHEELASRIRWDEPWDSVHNKAISNQVIDAYVSPFSNSGSRTCTNFFAVVGPSTIWPEQHSTSLRDVIDGASNTIQVIEADVPNINWMQPTDLSPTEAIRLLQPATGNPRRTANLVAFADGSVRLLKRLEEKQLRGFMSIASGRPFPGVAWPTASDDVVERRSPTPLPASQFRQTDVWPVLDKEIVAARNVVYCATFQIAWDQIRGRLNGVSPLLDRDPTLVQQLNAHPFPTSDLSPKSFVAHAGFGPSVVPRISDDLQQKFPDFQSEVLPDADAYALIAYAMLKKDLPFEFRFDRQKKPLDFSRAQVASFGLEDLDPDDIRHVEIAGQVKVLDYISDDDFVIRLTPRNGADEIVMAKIPVEKSVRNLVDRVRDRISKPHPHHDRFNLEAQETLIAPVLSLDVDRQFTELIGGRFKNAEFSQFSVLEARQIIHFRLDESGATLESEAIIVGEFGSEPPKPRKLIFDRPFLIWLRESKATEPYFVAWIANAELMHEFGRP